MAADESMVRSPLMACGHTMSGSACVRCQPNEANEYDDTICLGAAVLRLA